MTVQDMEFTLLRWAAWAPGLETRADWVDWARGVKPIVDDGSSPRLAFVEPMLRRRFSRLTRMALHVCYECLDGQHNIRTIFCSRHGEIHRTKLLLDAIVRGEFISPMGFSLSVHNTASGLYSIASGNTAPSSAIAADVDTLEMAVIDGVGHLQNQNKKPVLVVLADEPLPEFYQSFDDERGVPYALALLIGGKEFEGEALRLGTSPGNGASDEPHGLSLLHWLCSERDALTVSGERLSWQWVRNRG